jgi:DNA gyrase subunit A
MEVSSEERGAYLKMSRAVAGDVSDPLDIEENEDGANTNFSLDQTRYVQLSEAEQVLLTLSENGYGKRSSAYEYRVTGRGGKGIVGMATTERNGALIAAFPVEASDQIMLVTNGGQLIRVPVEGIRVAGRATQGVIVFNTAEGEKVVSVERVSEEASEDEGEGGED